MGGRWNSTGLSQIGLIAQDSSSLTHQDLGRTTQISDTILWVQLCDTVTGIVQSLRLLAPPIVGSS